MIPRILKTYLTQFEYIFEEAHLKLGEHTTTEIRKNLNTTKYKKSQRNKNKLMPIVGTNFY